MKTYWLFFLMVMGSIGSRAQELNAPQPRWLTPETRLELTTVAASLAADGLSTQKLYEFPHAFNEPNPLIRPVVKSRPGDTLYFTGVFGIDVLSTHWARKNHHEKLMHLFNFSLISWESFLAAKNYHHVNNSNEECGLHHPTTGCINSHPIP